MNTITLKELKERNYNFTTHKYEETFVDVEYKVGDGATICYYSDREPATIIEISEDGKIVKVQEDKAVRTDTNGMSDSQDYDYFRNENGTIHTFKRNRKGFYTDNGKATDYGTKLGFGYRRKYFDYSF